MRIDRNHGSKAKASLALHVIAALSMWTVWCVLMVYVGEPFTSPLLRAVVRIAAVLIPALAYLRSQGPREDAMGLRYRWRRGVLVAAVVIALHMTVVACSYTFDASLFPTEIDVWLNSILLSPFAEELLFRRVAIEHFCKRHNPVVAIVTSSLLFVVLHLPWWILSGDFHPLWIAGACTSLMLYGLVFGALYRLTRSLWASLLPHCINNFADTMIT